VGALSGRCILIVEDLPDTAEVLTEALTLAGADVRSASTAVEGLHILAKWTPDALLLDIELPDLDGYELLDTIRYSTAMRDIPAVAISAHPPDSSRRPRLGTGFATFRSKPIHLPELVQLLADLIV